MPMAWACRSSYRHLGDRFFISIDQDWAEKTYTNSLLDVLEERGISYEVVYDGANDTPVMTDRKQLRAAARKK